jgi:hypothetical protein
MEQKKSFFGPLLLIAVGVIWLLIKGGTIPASNLWALTYIWPFLLIALGLGLILRSYWAYTFILLDILIIGGSLLAILYAPQLGWNQPSMMFSFGWDGEDVFVGSGVRGSGNVVSENREVSGFDSIRVDYPAQVLISQGSQESLTVKAEDNLLPGLKTEVKGDELRIYYQSQDGEHVNPTKPVTVTITLQELNSIDFSSAGELTLDGLESDNLRVSLDGAGSMKLNDLSIKNFDVSLSGAGSATVTGTADDLNLTISGFGGFDGRDLKCNTVNVNISGAGSAAVWAEDTLDASISGAGSVTYYGSPEDVNKQISGVGGINHAEK